MAIEKKSIRKKRSRAHGFLARKRTKNGRNTIKRRRQKGRRRLSI